MANNQELIRRMRERAAKVRAEREAEAARREQELKHVPLQATETNKPEEGSERTEDNPFGSIIFNERQTQAIDLSREGKEFCLIGAAGTGKTTTMKAVVYYLMQRLAKQRGVSEASLHADSILLCSFTNRAVRNLCNAVSDVPGSAKFCRTIHSFLAFAPEDILVEGKDGETYTSMRFMPQFTKDNPKKETQLVVVEESSMVSLDLFKQLVDATPNASYIFLGDLNQLPPVFGDAILGYKLNELPVVELTEVYRQAMDSPIVAFQHQFTLKGILPGETHLEKINETSNGALTFKSLKNEKKYDPEMLAKAIAHHFINEHKAGNYDWKRDIILVPYNKALGSIEINRTIAQYFSEAAAEPVYEVIAGIERKYFAVGDYIVYNKEEYIITDITSNSGFVSSTQPQPPSVTLDREGHNREPTGEDFGKYLDDENFKPVDLNMLLRTTDGDLQDDAEELKAQASHVIEMVPANADETVEPTKVYTRGEINKIEFGYCITIHKSQGSEWEQVYLVMTNAHAPMLSRELLYTGMTRAKKKLNVLYSPATGPGRKNSSIARAIKRQRITGNTWQEKARQFFDKQEQYKQTMNDSYEEAANE